MTEVRLRNVDPGVIEVIRAIAKKNRRSMEAEIKAALFALANKRKKEMLARLRKMREAQYKKYGLLSDSTIGIREERDAM